MGGIGTQSVYSGHVCLEAYPFEPDTKIALDNGRDGGFVITGWSLSVSGSETTACPIQLTDGGDVPYASTLLPMNKSTTGDTLKTWKRTNCRIAIPYGSGVSIFGGAPGAVISGIVFVQVFG